MHLASVPHIQRISKSVQRFLVCLEAYLDTLYSDDENDVKITEAHLDALNGSDQHGVFRAQSH